MCPYKPTSAEGKPSHLMCPYKPTSAEGKPSHLMCPYKPTSAEGKPSHLMCPYKPTSAEGKTSQLMCPYKPTSAAPAPFRSLTIGPIVFPLTMESSTKTILFPRKFSERGPNFLATPS